MIIFMAIVLVLSFITALAHVPSMYSAAIVFSVTLVCATILLLNGY